NLLGQAVVGALWPFDPPATWPGFMAGHAATTVYSPGGLPWPFDEVGRARPGSPMRRPWQRSVSVRAVHDAIAVVTYAALAVGLTWASLRAFERVAGRPTRSAPGPASSDPTFPFGAGAPHGDGVEWSGPHHDSI